jgi:hypothetical protein
VAGLHFGGCPSRWTHGRIIVERRGTACPRIYEMAPKDFDKRIQLFLSFYDDLSACYRTILANGVLADAVQLFKDTYGTGIPDVKILDFIFHSAGRAKLEIKVT